MNVLGNMIVLNEKKDLIINGVLYKGVEINKQKYNSKQYLKSFTDKEKICMMKIVKSIYKCNKLNDNQFVMNENIILKWLNHEA